MRVITRGVIDWHTLQVEECDSYEYDGPVAECKDSGSPPQVDPYQQAGAEYQANTGTAAFNAALSHTNDTNPLGSTTWNVTGHSGAPTSTGGTGTPGAYGGAYGGGYGGIGFPTGTGGEFSGSGAPIYTSDTELAPQFNAMLKAPINEYNVVGDQGVGNAVQGASNSAFNQQMDYLSPQFAQQNEQLDSQLANQGITPGSAAYDYAKQEQGRQQTFSTQQAINNAIGAGTGELTALSGVGATELQNELAARNAPISEYNQLKTGSSGNVSAAAPDLAGAFGQANQNALAAYNSNVATNNANTQAGAGLLAMYLMAMA